MRSIYDQELRDIQRDSIHMSNLAFETLTRVMDAVRMRDFTKVEQVFVQDVRIRSMRMTINERVMRMIATQHPVAVDLRMLFYLVHMADEMEKIGCQASGIGRAVLRAGHEMVPLLEDIAKMSERCTAMFESMLSSSLGGDVQGVRAIVMLDDELDVLYEQVYREGVARQSTGKKMEQDIMLGINVARYIEHVGDHIVNWSRWWLYFNISDESETIVV